MNELTCVWEIAATLGEGPLWVAHENAVYWLDIIKKQVHRLALDTGAKNTWQFDIEVTSLAAREKGGFVGTIRDGFAFIDFETRSYEPIVLPEVEMRGNRFNDGKVDRYGRYWAGSMDNNGTLESGSLYRLDAKLGLQNMDANYIISNGPAFSKDNKTIYHTDTIKGCIYAFDLSENGDIVNKRLFIQLTEPAEGKPDGMTVDSEDCIWLCHFGGARITRYSPVGEILQVIPMPVLNITSCTFGGSQLDTLYITTARLHNSAEALETYPLAGSLFAFKPGVTGLPTPLFAG